MNGKIFVICVVILQQANLKHAKYVIYTRQVATSE